MTESLLELASALNNHFFNANKRLFWGYLLTTLALATLVWYQMGQKSSLWRFLFPKRIWLHPSAKNDYAVWLVNSGLKLFLIVPLLFQAAPIAIWLSQGLEALFGEVDLRLSKSEILFAFTLLVFVLDDFSRFLLHYLMHKVPVLWHFHKVHHSAEVLTPVTVYRIHPVESALYASRLILSQGLAIGLGFYFFGHRLGLVDVLGANVFVFAFNLLGANLRHSHIWLSFGNRVEDWLISPAQHQIHHSRDRAHFDRNLGSALAIWDRLFRTHMPASKIQAPLRFGLGGQPHGKLIALYLAPFRDAISSFKPKKSATPTAAESNDCPT